MRDDDRQLPKALAVPPAAPLCDSAQFHSIPHTAPWLVAPFLTAQWRHLVVLNFDVDAGLLAAHLPVGTELDFWQGRTFVSLVGFEFCDTRLRGVPIPFHRNFVEVNLRFYVRRQGPEGWRRGVVFLRELVPRRAVAGVARWFYGENYLAVPMRHGIEATDSGPIASGTAAISIATSDPLATHRHTYAWQVRGREHAIELTACGDGAPAGAGSLDEFIIEHYWGYSGGAGRKTIEYRVDHPRWNLWPAKASRLDASVTQFYGDAFAATLAAPPASAFYADGSPVTVYRGTRIA